ncbi:unnamed protein product [Adineta ricciae]|uniref:Staphylococcal nuclease domain-containing protein n=1 Tax=Adineta ricciae TaxID=249248 RepID=A0A814NH09_ADIRI|nr:unnamed protein product [Adineta ricciae]
MSLTSVQHAVVKSVLSGDTLVIRPISQSSLYDKEQRISLSYIKAPKLARPSGDPTNKTGLTVDEPYAFEAREYLRKKLIGQNICYTIDTQVFEQNRKRCTVYLGKDVETGENIIESLVSEGLVNLQKRNDISVNNISYKRLVTLVEQAKMNKRGQYSDDLITNHIRNVNWTLDDPKRFLKQHESSPPLDAIVEFIRDGNTVRCLLLPSYHLVTIQIAGIRCPMIKNDGHSEPFAEQAREYVESRLLQRQVKLIVSGVNKQSLVGTVLHTNGNIALHLLKEGLARCADWSLTFLRSDWRQQYRLAETLAKDNRSKIWQDTKTDLSSTDAAEPNGFSSDEYQAKVLEIVNGDALIVRDLRDNQVRKIYLASVRAPRAADFHLPSNTTTSRLKKPLYEIPYLFQARELLRKRLIGEIVRVITDYIQPANNEYSERFRCTVYIDNVNIAESLILRGLAKAIRHQQDDKKRSSHYDELLIAEHRAERNTLGLFSSYTGLHPVTNFIGDANNSGARSLLSTLQRSNWMEGIVEYVVSGSRFRIHLLKSDWIISFLLSSINCPRFERHSSPNNASPKQESEPFGAEALAFSEEHFLQRDVYIDIEGIDRGGNFIGRLLTTQRQSAVLMLVQAGLAKVSSLARGAADYNELLQAEERSREEHLGMWTSRAESVIEDTDNESESNYSTANESLCEPNGSDENDSSLRRGIVSHISSDLKVYIQYSDRAENLEQLQTMLQVLLNQKALPDGYIPEEDDLLAARFSVDNEWYRARVEKIDENNQITVYFVDYGNREVITDLNRLTILPPDYTQLPASAHEYQFAYVRVPSDDDQREKLRNALFNLIGNDECFIKVEYGESTTEYISLYRTSTKENLIDTLADRNLIVRDQGHSYDELQQVQSNLIISDTVFE